MEGTLATVADVDKDGARAQYTTVNNRHECIMKHGQNNHNAFILIIHDLRVQVHRNIYMRCLKSAGCWNVVTVTLIIKDQQDMW